jgi:hypothetical protein
MKIPIDDNRWESAQIGEKIYHIQDSVEKSYESYKNSYPYYFKYLNIDTNLSGKSVVEIGPARIAGLLFCTNYSKSYIIEPTPYEGIDYLYENKNIEIIKEKAESCNFPYVDEVWIFNLMQHVQDPDKLIEICKKHSKIIKFFEPIDLPTNNEHPYSFSLEDYKNYFGDCVKVYSFNGEIGFHQAKCAYGVYKTTNE